MRKSKYKHKNNNDYSFINYPNYLNYEMILKIWMTYSIFLKICKTSSMILMTCMISSMILMIFNMNLIWIEILILIFVIFGNFAFH